MTTTATTPYEVLGLTEDSSLDRIRKTYRRLAKQYHPDQGGDARKMAEINAAYAEIIRQMDAARKDGESPWGCDLYDALKLATDTKVSIPCWTIYHTQRNVRIELYEIHKTQVVLLYKGDQDAAEVALNRDELAQLLRRQGLKSIEGWTTKPQ